MTAILTAAGPITRRYDFVLLFDVTDGNPNGDPDAGNAPRVDPETGHGLVSDVCLKRKIRNYVSLAQADPVTGSPQPGYDVYVKERAILNDQHLLAYEALQLKPVEKKLPKDPNQARAVTAWMCQTFFDIRMFGAVMSTGVNAGQVRGPVQLTFSRSINPIVSLEQAITRMAVTNRADAEKKDREMGRKEIVPYGLYRVHGFISPHLAAQTGFSGEDLAILWKALCNMFDLDRSAARGQMTTRELIVFEHESTLGNAQAHRLFERVTIDRKDLSRPPRSYADYTVTVDGDKLPSGITIHRPCSG